jgi:hypothetical protein
MLMIKKRFGRVVRIIAVVQLLVHLATAGTSGSQQTGPSISDLRSQKTASSAFKLNSFALSFHRNRRDFAAAPPSNIAAELANAALPRNSGKLYALPDLSKANFLAPSRFQPKEFHNSTTSGLNKSKMLNTKHPGVSRTQ